MYGLFSRQAGTVPVSRFESKWMTSSGAFSKHGTLPSMKLCVCPQHLQWVSHRTTDGGCLGDAWRTITNSSIDTESCSTWGIVPLIWLYPAWKSVTFAKPGTSGIWSQRSPLRASDSSTILPSASQCTWLRSSQLFSVTLSQPAELSFPMTFQEQYGMASGFLPFARCHACGRQPTMSNEAGWLAQSPTHIRTEAWVTVSPEVVRWLAARCPQRLCGHTANQNRSDELASRRIVCDNWSKYTCKLSLDVGLMYCRGGTTSNLTVPPYIGLVLKRGSAALVLHEYELHERESKGGSHVAGWLLSVIINGPVRLSDCTPLQPIPTQW